MNALREALEKFDGVRTAPLIAAKDVAREDLGGLVALCGVPDVAVAATWVAKAFVEDGGAVSLAAAFDTLARQTEWAAQLYLLKYVHHAPKAAAAQIETVRSRLSSNKALVRV